VSNSGAVDAGVVFFVRWIEISRNGDFEIYEFDRFGGWFSGLEWMC